MKILKLIVASLAVFAMLTACGEGFKSSAIKSSASDPEQALADGEALAQEGETPISVDQAIRDSVEPQMSGLAASKIAQLSRSILGFSLEFSVMQTVGAGSENFSATANMLIGDIATSCRNKSRIVISRNGLSMSSLRAGNQVSLGTASSGNYEVTLQCTDDTCEEMVAIVRRMGSGGTDAMILLGLKKQGEQRFGRTVVETYTRRRVDNIDGFKAATNSFEDADFILSQCLMQEMGDSGSFGDDTNTGGGSGNDQTQTVVDPFVNAPPAAPTTPEEQVVEEDFSYFMFPGDNFNSEPDTSANNNDNAFEFFMFDSNSGEEEDFSYFMMDNSNNDKGEGGFSYFMF